MSDTAFVNTDVDGATTTITLARPERRNALGLELTEQLLAAMRQALERDDLRVLVLAAEGAAFCAGADLKEELDDEGRLRRGQCLVDVILLLWEARVPVVARVQGSVRGGAAGLIAACDIAVASDEVTFSFPEVRIGVVPAIIAPPILARCRWDRILELFLTGDTFDAAHAADVGLIARHVPAADLDTAVDEYRTSLLAGAPRSLQITRRLARDHLGLDLRAALADALQTSAAAFGSPDAQAARIAVAARRQPPWVPEGTS